MSTGIKESGVRKSRRSFSMLELDMMDIPCESFPYIVEPYKADHWDLTDEALGLRIFTVFDIKVCTGGQFLIRTLLS